LQSPLVGGAFCCSSSLQPVKSRKQKARNGRRTSFIQDSDSGRGWSEKVKYQNAKLNFFVDFVDLRNIYFGLEFIIQVKIHILLSLLLKCGTVR